MPPSRRIGVVILLSLGMLVGVTGVARVYYVWLANVKSYDLTWFLYPVYMLTTVEMDIGIVSALSLIEFPAFNSTHAYGGQMCASAPSIRRLWSKPKDASSYLRSTTKDDQSRLTQASGNFAVSTNSSGRGADDFAPTTDSYTQSQDVELDTKGTQGLSPWDRSVGVPKTQQWQGSR
jgi:hypothetical protein